MPRARRRKTPIARELPAAELQQFASWILGDMTDPVEVRETRAAMFFIPEEYLQAAWLGIRCQAITRFKREPEKFAEQIDVLVTHGILGAADRELLHLELSGRRPM